MSNQEWLWECERTLASRKDEINRLIDEILEQLSRQNWPERERFAVHMALEESFTNAVMHGNKKNESLNVYIVCHLNDRYFFCSVRDEGSGFPVANIPDPRLQQNIDMPTGRGVFLIRSFMTRVWFNEKGNEIFMEKVLS